MHCKTCNTTKTKDDFYKSRKTSCKECVKASVKANRLEKIDHYRQFDRMRGSMPHRVAARQEYAKTAAYAESHKAAAIRWSEKHPERRRANIAVNNALRDGVLIRLPCWVCGEQAEAHHPDYSRPLDVVWLCQPHHKQAHKAVN